MKNRELPSDWMHIETTTIAGHRVATSDRKSLSEAMLHDCRAFQEQGGFWKPRLVFDINGQGISLFWSNLDYRKWVESADIIHADGGFVVTVSRIVAGPKIAERTPTTDVFHDFAKTAAENGLSFYLLGGTESVNRRCAEIMSEKYSKLRIVGRRNGFFNEEEMDEILDEINRLRPDVLWVGLGKPKEQAFSVKYRDRLQAGWIVTCGGCFNFVAGTYSRAPQWMQKFNLEWVYRAFSEPRLFWRYLTTSPHAIYLVLREDLFARFHR